MKCNKCGNEYDYRCEVCWPEKTGSVGKPQLCDVCELLNAIDSMQEYIQTGKNLGALSSYIARVITVSKKVRANFA